MRLNSLFLTALVLGSTAHTEPNNNSRLVELPVLRVFIPTQGYDDNDTIEAVIEGDLPNACYRLENQNVHIDKEKKIITLKQFALRLASGSCKEGSTPDQPQLITPIPFTETVSLGNLPAGNYQIVYSPKPGQTQMNSFDIVPAPVPTLDSLPYAMVTEVSVQDIVPPGVPLKVRLSGILNNSCYQLNEKVEVRNVGDVSIILPTLKIERQSACLMYTRPFSINLELEAINVEKRHLIHVRSMHGKSLNRVCSVKKSET